MKALLVSIFFGLVCAEVPAQFNAIIQSTTKIAEQCKQQTNATEDIQHLIDTFKLPTSPEGKCMVACVMRNMSLMKGDKVDNKAVDQYLEKILPGVAPFVQIYLNPCYSTGSSGKDACENATAFVNCCSQVLKDNFSYMIPKTT